MIAGPRLLSFTNAYEKSINFYTNVLKKVEYENKFEKT